MVRRDMQIYGVDIATFSGSCLSGCICFLFDRFSDVSAGRLPEAGPIAWTHIARFSQRILPHHSVSEIVPSEEEHPFSGVRTHPLGSTSNT